MRPVGKHSSGGMASRAIRPGGREPFRSRPDEIGILDSAQPFRSQSQQPVPENGSGHVRNRFLKAVEGKRPAIRRMPGDEPKKCGALCGGELRGHGRQLSGFQAFDGLTTQAGRHLVSDDGPGRKSRGCFAYLLMRRFESEPPICWKAFWRSLPLGELK